MSRILLCLTRLNHVTRLALKAMSTTGPVQSHRVTVRDLLEMKKRGEKIVCLTAYDYLFGRLVDEGGADMVLVGDSLGQVVLGYDSTIPVTLEDIIHHSKAVRRGVKRGMLIVDMPFMSFQISPAETLRNAGCLRQVEDTWTLAPEAPLAAVDLGIPDTVQGIVLARLDRLPEPLERCVRIQARTQRFST